MEDNRNQNQNHKTDGNKKCTDQRDYTSTGTDTGQDGSDACNSNKSTDSQE